MDLRNEFILRLGRGERLTDLCREYGIARKTGEKFKRRFREQGLAGLQDQSRAPGFIPHKTPPELVEVIVAHRRQHPTWGPRKLKETLQRSLGRSMPAASTIGDILGSAGLIVPRRRRPPHQATPTALREATAPNDVWCIDYKGQFRLIDGTYCYPLTLTDQFSRYILGCEGMGAISDEAARAHCLEVFATYGLPTVMRSDNGVPFASSGLAGLTKLSVLWLRLGIELERTRPAHPQDNGRHERMHRTLKQETTRPARGNLLQQQERFDAFVDEFNQRRPHEALGMRPPASVYQPSTIPCPTTLPDLDYSTCDDVRRVSTKGMLTLWGRRQLYLAAALAGEYVGLREDNAIADRWLVSFAHLHLGYVEPGSHHFTALPLSTPTRLASGAA
ncbi:MAG TPA: IS481 family transposase [Hyphomicrobiaceae bacterium]|nr:IS481 family transposase [Hyphomicrobiaceae bacterium]